MTPQLNFHKQRSHLDFIGASQLGKSKGVEWRIWEDVIHHDGVCYLAYDDASYDALIDRFVFFDLEDRLIPINLSDQEHVIGINPWKPDGDLNAQADRLVSTLSDIYDSGDTAGLKMRQWGGALFRLVLHSGMPLETAIHAFDYPANPTLHTALAECLPNDLGMWQFLAAIDGKRMFDWTFEVGPISLRVNQLVRSAAYPFLSGNLDIRQVMDESACMLVNLKPSGNCDAQAAKDFAAFLFAEFMYAAMSRRNKRQFTIYCDECQEYIR